MKNKYNLSILGAILAAVLYAISSPFSKLLLQKMPPTILAAFLYLGAGIGMSLLGIIRKKSNIAHTEQRLSKMEYPHVVGMVFLDIAAPILLMISLTMTSAANVSLLNNFEIVATAVIAFFLFKEAISKKLCLAIGLITLSSIILSFEDMSSFSFSLGSVLVILACICWGFENNCTRKISHKDPLQIVVIKGFGSGLGSLFIALMVGEHLSTLFYTIFALLLGFISYGLSILFYVYAQRGLSAAKTSSYYAISPFIGVFLSFLMFHKMPTLSFVVALLLMIAGAYLASLDKT